MWNDNASVTGFGCTDPDCREGGRLYTLQSAMVAEYNALLFWAVAVGACLQLISAVDFYDLAHRRAEGTSVVAAQAAQADVKEAADPV